MKKVLFTLCALCSFGLAQAQIIQGSTLTVEEKKFNVSNIEGYRGFVDAGLGANLERKSFAFDVLTTHGFQLPSGLFFGAATGISKVDGCYAIPLLADIRYYFKTQHKAHLFADVKLGYNFGINDDSDSDSPYKHKLNGVHVSPGVGVEIGKFQVGVYYYLPGTEVEYKFGNTGESPMPDYYTRAVSKDNPKETSYQRQVLLLRLGFNF